METHTPAALPSVLALSDRLSAPAIARIVVPRASEAGYEPALAAAVDLAVRHDLPLHVITVTAGDSVHLDDPAATIRAAHPPARVTAEAVDSAGDPADVIAKALRLDDLVVMATSAGTSDGTSVAQRLVHRWDGPVLMLGPQCPRTAVDIGSVALAVDGSALAERALPAALDLAHLLGAPLTLVEVIPDRVVMQVRKLAARGEHVAESAYVSDLAARLTAAGKPTGWTVVHDDDPVHGLQTFLADHDVAVLVMAAHGRGGLPVPAFGSTCMGVVATADIPVAVTSPVQHATPAFDIRG